MGRYNFRASRILQTAKQAVEQQRIDHKPTWYRTVRENTPPHILVRNPPVLHSGYPKPKPGRKVKRIYQPQKISYPEDRMRDTFFAHHPWELARPRIVQENNRADGWHAWDRVRPEGLGLQPENVIQRQLWLIEHEGKDPQAAYDIARREFYRQRMRQDIERKVAKEEAMHVGAYFQKSTVAWGMELEDRKFYGFKEWATKRLAVLQSRRETAVLGVGARNTESGEEPMQSQALIGEAAAEEASDGTGEADAVPAKPFQVPEDRKSTLRI